jgi:hypothetical protein
MKSETAHPWLHRVPDWSAGSAGYTLLLCSRTQHCHHVQNWATTAAARVALNCPAQQHGHGVSQCKRLRVDVLTVYQLRLFKHCMQCRGGGYIHMSAKTPIISYGVMLITR